MKYTEQEKESVNIIRVGDAKHEAIHFAVLYKKNRPTSTGLYFFEHQSIENCIKKI
jgi:hypothetical protein